ncbi:MAG: ATP-binding protein, partial [Pseudomonadota bacterium]
LGFLYFQISGGSDALAAIGLIAFVGVAQFLPSLIGGIFWRGATQAGALAGLGAGFALWLYTLFLPSFGGDVIFSAEALANGPWGIEALKPQALFGLDGADPLVHALVWSLGVNLILFLAVSSFSEMNPLERLQGAQFVDVFHTGAGGANVAAGSAKSEDLFILAQRILGTDPARDLFDEMAREQGRDHGLPMATEDVVARVERELAGSIGGASAHAMVGRIAGDRTVGVTELMDIAGETQKLIETSRQLSSKSDELARAAQQLRDANARLRQLDAQKDAFLSQVSHELRTPMTSIRSFSEILLGDDPVPAEERTRFVRIINEESLRLTRLLDEILDISRLEAGTLDLPLGRVEVSRAIQAAIDTVSGIARTKRVEIVADPVPEVLKVIANSDRLRQVLINLISNAVKYNDADEPQIRIRARRNGPAILIDVEDNGGGVTRDEAGRIFEKFARGTMSARDHGAGLGLPISRAIMRNMGGELGVAFNPDGTSFFRVSLRPAPAEEPAEAAPEETSLPAS